MPVSKGFTFIEVLLCLLLFGIGMLGALASQMYARQQVLMATQRLLATAIVADIAASVQSLPSTTPSIYGVFEPTSADPIVCDKADQCSGKQLLQAQVAQQLATLSSGSGVGLSAPELCIVAGGLHPQIQLSWRGVVTRKFQSKTTLCPVADGFFHVALTEGKES